MIYYPYTFYAGDDDFAVSINARSYNISYYKMHATTYSKSNSSEPNTNVFGYDDKKITASGSLSEDGVKGTLFIKGYYRLFDGTIVDTEKPVINYPDYFCIYTFPDGTTTDSSTSVIGHEFGGGVTRGGGAGRDVDENGKTKPVITDDDTYGSDDERPSDKKYYRVCYDKDTSSWQPHGTIQIVNNTIINNTYIITDGTEEPATDTDIPPATGSDSDWPEDTPSWIEFLGNLIGGLLRGLGDAIGGLGDAIGGIANALGNIISSLIDALTGLIKMLFIPSDNFMSDKLTSMNETVNQKLPVVGQVGMITSSVVSMMTGSGSSPTSSGAPSYIMQLPSWLGSGEFELFDFQFFDQHRTLFHAIISFSAWSLYLLRVPYKISNAMHKARKK